MLRARTSRPSTVADSEPCWSGPTFSSAACTSPPSGTGISTYTYNSVGELTQMVDNHGTGHSHTDTYGYDKDGNETSASMTTAAPLPTPTTTPTR